MDCCGGEGGRAGGFFTAAMPEPCLPDAAQEKSALNEMSPRPPKKVLGKSARLGIVMNCMNRKALCVAP